jgi:hypothetical protein
MRVGDELDGNNGLSVESGAHAQIREPSPVRGRVTRTDLEHPSTREPHAEDMMIFDRGAGRKQDDDGPDRIVVDAVDQIARTDVRDEVFAVRRGNGSVG